MADYDKLKKEILDMKLGERKTVYTSDDKTEIIVSKPLKVPTKLKNSKKYNPKTNFQIILAKGGKKEFLPNHMRFMIDLDIKKREDPKKAEVLFDAIDGVYRGEDPLKYQDKLSHIFPGEIETSFTDLCLSQLFMLEQDINYTFGKIHPPKSYLMGYIRMIRNGAEEIDKLLWSSTRHPPRKEFREA